MSLVRPELAAAVHRWREVIIACGVVVLGGWVATFGGLFFLGLGLLIAVSGVALGINGWRRLRFRPAGLAPGIVQIVEGQIAYFGPEEGGFAALGDIEELRLEDCAPGRCWVLVQPDGGVLRVPVAAQGAEVLFDAFATLPGIDMQAVIAALNTTVKLPRVLWLRRPRPALT